MSIDEYFGDWLKIIDRTELQRLLSTLSLLYKTKKIYPNQSDVFKAFHLCPLKELKAVFIGQDPYPDSFQGKPRATGILFGNRSEISEDNLSPSLKIIKEGTINFEIPHNCIIFDQTLESWAKQGVLMINSALTVEAGKVGSHSLMWREFTSLMLKNLSEYETGITYVLFGEQAQSFKSCIGVNNYVICVKHPAYYARKDEKMPSWVFPQVVNNVYKVFDYKLKLFDELNY